jgi:phage shock protein C
MTGIYESLWRNGLVRPSDNRVLGGVCSGLARRVGIGETPMRWLFVLLVIVLPGSPILIYPVLWILMPDDQWVARNHGYPQQPPAAPYQEPYPPQGGTQGPAA